MSITVRLTIDNRERGRGEALGAVFKLAGHDVDYSNLSVGDYCSSNLLGVEYKSPNDFVSSLVDGRLFAQVSELSESFRHPFVVVGGSLRDCMECGGVGASAVQGAVTSVLMRTGVPVVFLGDSDFASFLLSLLKRLESRGSYEYSPIRRGASTEESRVFFLSSLPGIGPTRAKSLLDVFGSPASALGCVEDWGCVRGIGPATIRGVLEVLGNERCVD